jgi:hypothetical protein
MQVGHKALERSDDEGDIRFLALPERGGDADDEGVGLPDLIEGGGGGELSLGDQGGEGLGGDIDQVGLAAIELGDTLQVDIDSAHRETGLGEFDRERETHVTQANDVDTGSPVVDLALELLFPRAHLRSPFRHGPD